MVSAGQVGPIAGENNNIVYAYEGQLDGGVAPINDGGDAPPVDAFQPPAADVPEMSCDHAVSFRDDAQKFANWFRESPAGHLAAIGGVVVGPYVGLALLSNPVGWCVLGGIGTIGLIAGAERYL